MMMLYRIGANNYEVIIPNGITNFARIFCAVIVSKGLKILQPKLKDPELNKQYPYMKSIIDLIDCSHPFLCV